MDHGASLLAAGILALLLPSILSHAQKLQSSQHLFGPFNSSYYSIFVVNPPATISNDALQITPDSAGNFTLANKSGRVLFSHPFKLWDGNDSSHSAMPRLASFDSTMRINIFRINNSSAPGEGFAFIIAPDLEVPQSSHGQYLGLTNSTTDGNSSNHLVAVELDTFKQDFDPDDNHMGLDINSVRSTKTVSLSEYGIQIAPVEPTIYIVWIQYDGGRKVLDVYMAKEGQPKPANPMLSADLDLSAVVKQHSYFGFAASTGNNIQLNCVLGWNLTVEILPDDKDSAALKIGVGVGVPVFVLVVIGAAGLAYYYIRKMRAAASDANIVGRLKSLPGMPREFGFRDLKKATNKFDEKQKLGEGGFGVIYKGVLPNENVEIAVKKFSRDSIKGIDDFLSELTIINRLRHKHLVPLLGWCHKNGMLLLVYDYMPNGSLDKHIFCGPNTTTLEWNLRYKIISGVASALHYLHNEYDQTVVHRDLKASNIMLDANFNARLGDFGLARAIDNEKTSYAELDGVPGTMGYIAPECFHTGKASRESDVYGFGAVVLEVVCGQRPWSKIGEYQLLVDWVWSLHREDKILEGMDERLGKDYIIEEAKRLLLLGLACSHPIANERPKTQDIMQILSGSVEVPFVPPFKPAFVWPSMGPIKGQDGYTDTTPITSSQYGSGWSNPYASRESNMEYSDSSSLVCSKYYTTAIC